mgnify:CR=1 FL=1
MMKVNLGLTGILVIIFLILHNFFHFKQERKKIYDDLDVIKLILEDLDDDLHAIEEKIK